MKIWHLFETRQKTSYPIFTSLTFGNETNERFSHPQKQYLSIFKQSLKNSIDLILGYSPKELLSNLFVFDGMMIDSIDDK